MTTPSSEALSGFLDGELSVEGAETVLRRAAADPQVRTELETLSRRDAQWRTWAHEAQFRPHVRLPSAAVGPIPSRWWMVLVAPLLALWTLRKVLTGLDVDLTLNGVALGVLVMGLLWVQTAEGRFFRR